MDVRAKKCVTFSLVLSAALLLSACAASATAGTAHTAATAPSAGTARTGSASVSSNSESDNQDALEVFRGWILTRPGFDSSGWVGSIDDLKAKSMTIMWYGPRTAFLSEVIAEGARRGIPVTTQDRAYSLAQVNAASAEIWRQEAAGQWAGFKISTIVGVSPSTSTITVTGTYTSLPASQRAPQVRALATVVLGVAVRIEPGISFSLLPLVVPVPKAPLRGAGSHDVRRVP